MSQKLIVTNVGRLHAKYGAGGYAEVATRVQGLASADKQRGVSTHVAELDGGPGLAALLGDQAERYAAADWSSAEQVKRAIDALCAAQRAVQPNQGRASYDFIMILGATDVVPMVPLVNETFGQGGGMNGDPVCPSDLPYACASLMEGESLSTSMYDYLAPTRVLSRLPDQVGATDPAPLLAALQTTIDWRSSAPKQFARHLGISAEIWKKQTTEALTGGLGLRGSLELVPPEEPDQNTAPEWQQALWDQNLHYINCHGAEGQGYFLGEGTNQVGSLPYAHLSREVAEHAKPGTVVVAECCYGANLYVPDEGRAIPIPNAYLARGGLGFVGATITAYGSGTGKSFSDRLCQLVVKHLMEGASLGRAMLEARHDYVAAFDKDATAGIQLSKWDAITLCEFNVYGDPSVLPVRVVAAPDGTAKRATSVAPGAAPHLSFTEHLQQALQGRGARRAQIRARAETLRQRTGVPAPPVVEDASTQPASNAVQAELEQRIRTLGRYFPTVRETQHVGPPAAASPANAGHSPATPGATFHIVHAEHEDGAEHKQTAFQALEVDGRIVRLDQMIRR